MSIESRGDLRAKRRMASFMAASVLVASAAGLLASWAASPPDVGHSGVALNPRQASVEVSAGAWTEYVDSGIVRRDGATWFATLDTIASGVVVTINRWTATGWRRVGAVGGLLMQQPYEWLGTASITGSGRPDFVAQSNPEMNDDDGQLAVVSYLHGAWRAVPFLTGSDTINAPDAVEVSDGRVESAMGTGGAGERPSFAWYRFDPQAGAFGAFVPAPPPGPAPPCTPGALGAAPRQQVSPLAMWRTGPLQDAIDQPLSVRRSACADGWALGTGDSSDGRAAVGLFEQQAHGGWLRVGIGSPRALLANAALDYDLPPSVLRSLAAGCGIAAAGQVRVPPTMASILARSRSGASSAQQVATVPVEVTPGGEVASDLASPWLAAVVESQVRNKDRDALLSVTIYRWSDGAWSPRAALEVRLAARRPLALLAAVNDGELGGSRLPDFEIESDAMNPSWLVVVSGNGDSWHVTPFQLGTRRSLWLDDSSWPYGQVLEVAVRGGFRPYRLTGGVMRRSGRFTRYLPGA